MSNGGGACYFGASKIWCMTINLIQRRIAKNMMMMMHLITYCAAGARPNTLCYLFYVSMEIGHPFDNDPYN